MQLPNFDDVDLEYSELNALLIDTENSRIVMTMNCPIAGWWWRKSLPDALREFLLKTPELSAKITLTFLDAQAIRTDLPDFDDGYLDPSDLRFFKLASGRGGAYLEFEDGGRLEFDFADCVQSEIWSTKLDSY